MPILYNIFPFLNLFISFFINPISDSQSDNFIFPERNLIQNRSSFCNAADFGAIGDGVANDVNALNNAFSNSECDTVFLDEGVYRIASGSLLVKKHKTIIGNNSLIYFDYHVPDESFLIQMEDSTSLSGIRLKMNKAKQNISLNRNSNGIGSPMKSYSIKLNDIEIDSIKGKGIGFEFGIENFEFHNIQQSNSYDHAGGSGYGIAINNGINGVIKNSSFNSNKNYLLNNGSGVIIGGSSYNILIENVTASHNFYDGFIMYSQGPELIPQEIYFKDCIAEYNINWSGFHSTPVNYPPKNTFFENCIARFNKIGFDCSGARKFYMTDCIADSNTSFGALFGNFNSSDSSVISGGAIRFNGFGDSLNGSGIVIEQSDVHIENVIINNNRNWGIRISTKNIFVNGNVISDNGTNNSEQFSNAGIIISGVELDSIFINNNSIFNSTENGYSYYGIFGNFPPNIDFPPTIEIANNDFLNLNNNINLGPPDVVTMNFSDTDTSSTTLHGSVRPRGVATQYKFEYGLTPFLGDESTFESVGDGTVFVNVSDIIENLNPGSNYFYRIKAENINGVKVGEINNLVTKITFPKIVMPLDSAIDVSVSTIFQWNKASGAMGYILQIFDDELLSNPVEVLSSDTIYQIADTLLYQKEYYWRIKSFNESDTSVFSSLNLFTTVIPPPENPLLLLPENNAVNIISQPNLIWNSSISAESYRIQLSTDSLFNNIEIDTTIIDTLFQTDTLNFLTDYFWRVKAINVGGESEYSEVWKFTTIIEQPEIVQLESPLNNSVNNSIHSELIWQSSPRTENYKLQLSTDSSFANLILDSTITDTSYQLDTLNFLTDYFWRVKAINVGGESEHSEVWKFTTIIEQPEIVQLESPLSNSVNNSIHPELNWQSSPRVENYKLQLSTDSSFAIIIIDSIISDTSYQLDTLNFLTDYFWRVKAINVGGESEYSLSWKFTTIIDQPEIVQLESPFDNSVNNSIQPELIWYPSARTESYKIQLSTDSSFANLILDSTISDTSYQLDTLDFLTDYFWRVKAINVGGESDYSEAWKFTTIIEQPEIVQLESPLNNSVNNSIHPILNWQTAPRAENYKLQLSTDSSFANLIIDSTISDTSYQLDTLNFLTDYFWRVKAINVGGESEYSEAWKFTTIIEQPEIVQLESPLNNSVNNSILPSLNWQSSPRVENYKLQLSTDSSFVNLIIDSTISDTIYQPDTLDFLSDYYWRVKAMNVGGESEYSEAWKFTTIIEQPEIVQLETPLNNSVNNSILPSLNWQSSPRVENYKLQLSTDSSFAILIIDSTITDTSYQLDILIFLTEYFWRVKAINVGGESEYSEAWKFTTIIEQPEIVQLESPLNNSVNNSIHPALNWQASPRAENYKLQLSTDSLFTNIILIDSSITDTIYQLDTLNFLTDYFWRVKAINVGGESEYSEAWKFITIIEQPEIIQLETPLNNSVDNSILPSLNWQFSPRVENYKLQLSTDSSFVNLIIDSTISDTIYQLDTLNFHTNYFWRVKAMNVGGESEYSEAWKFTTIIEQPEIVQLESPLNNSVNNSIHPILNWQSSPRVENYKLQLSTDSLFTNIILIDSLIIDTSYQLDTLNFLTDYFWRVKASNVGGESEYSEAWKFTTIIEQPEIVQLETPLNNSVDNSILPSLNWQSSPRTENYKLQLSTDSSFSNLILDSTITDTIYQLDTLNFLTDYFWRVKAINVGGESEYSESWKFTTIIEKPETPNLSTPENNSIGLIQPISLIWENADRADRYNLCIANDSTFNDIVLIDSALIDTFYIINDLENLKNYYWKISASNIGGESNFSDTYIFKTIGVPFEVNLVYPPADSVDLPLEIFFKWNMTIDQTNIFNNERSSILNYWFEISGDTTTPEPLVLDSLLLDTFKLVTDLDHLKNYYWRVKAKNEAGWNNFSGWYNFKTIISSPTLSQPENNSIGISLNPELRWSYVEGFVNYNIQVSEDEFFTKILKDTIVTDSIYSCTSLNPLSVYYWKVRAKSENEYGDFSPTFSFNTKGTPLIVNPVFPPNDTVNIPLTINFNWSKAIDQTEISKKNIFRVNSNLYHFEVTSDTVDFRDLYVDSTLIDTVKQYTLQKKSTTYYWRVKAYNEAGWGEFFQWNSFRTVANIPPSASQLNDTINYDAGRVLFQKLNFSSKGSIDPDGDISFTMWYVNDSLVSSDENLSYDFKQGTSEVKLIVIDNDNESDTSKATVVLGVFKRALTGNNYSAFSMLGDSLLFIASSKNGIFKLNIDGDIQNILDLNNKFYSPVTITEDSMLYITSDIGEVRCISINGSILWERQFPNDTILSGCVIDTISKTVFIGTKGNKFYALNKNSGAVLWQINTDGPVQNTSVINKKGKLIITTTRGKIHVVNLLMPSGEHNIVTFDLQDSVFTSAALDSAGNYYIGTKSGKIFKIGIDEFSNINVIWTHDISTRILTSAIISNDDKLYLIAADTNLYCLDIQSGNILFNYFTNSEVISTPVLSNEDELYFANSKGSVIGINNKGEKLFSHFENSYIRASLLYNNGVLYSAYEDGSLIAFFTDDQDNNTYHQWKTFLGNNLRNAFQSYSPSVSVTSNQESIPEKYNLYQNYPNPFNSQTTISFDIPVKGFVKIKIYDITGREVNTLADKIYDAGSYKIQFSDNRLASGLYIIKFDAKEFSSIKKMLLIK